MESVPVLDPKQQKEEVLSVSLPFTDKKRNSDWFFCFCAQHKKTLVDDEEVEKPDFIHGVYLSRSPLAPHFMHFLPVIVVFSPLDVY
jgi:hypothetical protein